MTTETDIASLISQQLDRLLAAQVTPEKRKAVESGQFDTALWQECEALGLTGALVPESAGGADVLIHNFKLGTLPKWGLGYEDVLSKRFPKLVQCTITDFGSTGPLAGMAGYDVAVQGFVGLASINGEAGSDGTKIGLPLIDHATGLAAVNAISMAPLERVQSGKGQHVGVSLYNNGLTMLHPAAAGWIATGKVPRPTGNTEHWVAPYGAYACADGKVFTGAALASIGEKWGETVGARNPMAAQIAASYNALLAQQ